MNKAEHPSFCACIEGTTKLQHLQVHLPLRGCGRKREDREEQEWGCCCCTRKSRWGLGKAGLRRMQDKALSSQVAWKRVDAGSGSSHKLGAEVTWVQGHLGQFVAEKSSVDSSIHRNNTWLEKPWPEQLEGWESFIKLSFWCPVLVSLSKVYPPGQYLKLSTEFVGWGLTCRAVLCLDLCVVQFCWAVFETIPWLCR